MLSQVHHIRQHGKKTESESIAGPRNFHMEILSSVFFKRLPTCKQVNPLTAWTTVDYCLVSALHEQAAETDSTSQTKKKKETGLKVATQSTSILILAGRGRLNYAVCLLSKPTGFTAYRLRQDAVSQGHCVSLQPDNAGMRWQFQQFQAMVPVIVPSPLPCLPGQH